MASVFNDIKELD